MPDEIRKARAAIRKFALGLPEAYEDSPWGESVAKVDKKVFVFLGLKSDDLGFSCKLPVSAEEALHLPFAEPTGYGLGKAGWVTFRFSRGERPPVGLLLPWVLESYRAIAPKKLIAELDNRKSERTGQKRRVRG